MEHYIYISSTAVLNRTLHLHKEHSICIWSTVYIYGHPIIYMERDICKRSTPFINGSLLVGLTQIAPIFPVQRSGYSV